MIRNLARSLLLIALCSQPLLPAWAVDPPPAPQGTVLGTVEVRYQAPKGLFGKMSESTRSRKWVFRVASADDRGAAYRVKGKFEVREGGARPFELALPAGSYRFVDGVNDLSGGLESMSVPVDAYFDVVAGAPAYVGRLLIQVEAHIGYALGATAVADCGEVDLPWFMSSHPDLATYGEVPSRILSIGPADSDQAVPPSPSCEALKTPQSNQ